MRKINICKIQFLVAKSIKTEEKFKVVIFSFFIFLQINVRFLVTFQDEILASSHIETVDFHVGLVCNHNVLLCMEERSCGFRKLWVIMFEDF